MTDANKGSLFGPNILLEGPSGTGKTFALGTLVEWAQANGCKVRVLFAETGLETLLGYWTDSGKTVPSCLAYHQQLTTPIDLGRLMKAADNVGKLDYKALTSLQDMERSGERNAFYKILQSCSKFIDDRTGEDLGSVDSWGLDTIFVIDSLSEVANACLKMVIGSKPTASQPDYGVAQNNLMNFLRLCTQGTRCTFVMIAHVDRSTDQISGQPKIMTKAIGQAIAGDIPPLFSDVIYTTREGNEFWWDTAAFGVDTKTRSLGYRSKIRPDFAQIMDLWKKRGEAR